MGSAIKREVLSKYDSPSLGSLGRANQSPIIKSRVHRTSVYVRFGLVHITFPHSSFLASLPPVLISLHFVSVFLDPIRTYMPTSCFIYSSLHVLCNPSSYLWASIPIRVFLYK